MISINLDHNLRYFGATPLVTYSELLHNKVTYILPFLQLSRAQNSLSDIGIGIKWLNLVKKCVPLIMSVQHT